MRRRRRVRAGRCPHHHRHLVQRSRVAPHRLRARLARLPVPRARGRPQLDGGWHRTCPLQGHMSQRLRAYALPHLFAIQLWPRRPQLRRCIRERGAAVPPALRRVPRRSAPAAVLARWRGPGRKSRSRSCVAPTSLALKQSHSASNPSAARSSSTRESPCRRNPGTSSRKTKAGSTSRMIRAMSGQIHLASAVPLRWPATLHGWHGTPAVTQSTTPRHGSPAKVATSSQTGAQSRALSSIRATRTDAA